MLIPDTQAQHMRIHNLQPGWRPISRSFALKTINVFLQDAHALIARHHRDQGPGQNDGTTAQHPPSTLQHLLWELRLHI